MNIFDYYLKTIGEVGYVEETSGSIVTVDGLPNAVIDELVLFEDGTAGQIFALKTNQVQILVFSKTPIKPDTRVTRTNKNLEAIINENMPGKIIDPLNLILNTIDPKNKDNFLAINGPVKGIVERETIAKPLQTGVSIVDMAIPLAKGQRELVIGDRKTGKSAFLLQTILNQALEGNLCIYAAIGKKTSDINKIKDFAIKNNIMNHLVIVASSSEDPSGIINLTPYISMTIAEYFRDLGTDVLLILDDLSTHAKVYREISLLAEKFPGRGSYPADTFYMHARLLERAGNFKTEKGTFAITCLPVAETAQGDLSGYIQTNLMSITDGHLYFDSNLFAQGRRPSVNPFLSVTRVGRQTQTRLKHDIGREILVFLTLFEKLQNFVHFGAELNQNIKTTLDVGNKLLKFFNQSMGEIISADLQIILFSLLWTNAWGTKDYFYIEKDMELIISKYKSDALFREKISNLLKKPTFNEFLGDLRKKTNEFITV